MAYKGTLSICIKHKNTLSCVHIFACVTSGTYVLVIERWKHCIKCRNLSACDLKNRAHCQTTVVS